MKNIFVLLTILGHLPVILSAKRKGSDNMKQILIVLADKNWANRVYDGSLVMGNMMLLFVVYL